MVERSTHAAINRSVPCSLLRVVAAQERRANESCLHGSSRPAWRPGLEEDAEEEFVGAALGFEFYGLVEVYVVV